ncbi:hypothetical protein GGI12_002976 [Dipsacomyces acuminosporus]|nr:hypothetical protein GGI12_002976 [Dipsacomyces acuminosporus]
MLSRISRPYTRFAATASQHLALPRQSGCLSMAIRFYTPADAGHGTTGSATRKSPSPQDLLEALHPQKYHELLASAIDAEEDYGNDLETAGLNNTVAAMRVKLAREYENMTKEQIDEYSKRNMS